MDDFRRSDSPGTPILWNRPNASDSLRARGLGARCHFRDHQSETPARLRNFPCLRSGTCDDKLSPSESPLFVGAYLGGGADFF